MRKFRVTVPIAASISVEVSVSEREYEEIMSACEDPDEAREEIEQFVQGKAESAIVGASGGYSFNVRGGEIQTGGEPDWEEVEVEECD